MSYVVSHTSMTHILFVIRKNLLKVEDLVYKEAFKLSSDSLFKFNNSIHTTIIFRGLTANTIIPSLFRLAHYHVLLNFYS
jgi:hypothetical protein